MLSDAISQGPRTACIIVDLTHAQARLQVLASPELRKRYDAKGAEGVDVDFMDHAEFFNALFGSDRFEHLVGELMIAAASRHGDLNGEQMRRVQARPASRCLPARSHCALDLTRQHCIDWDLLHAQRSRSCQQRISTDRLCNARPDMHD